GGKRKRGWRPEDKRVWSEPAQPHLRSARQCALGGWPRSTSDDQAQGERAEPLSLRPWRAQPSTDTPDEGVRRMTAWGRSHGDTGQQQRGARRRRPRGVERLSPQPRMRAPPPAHRVYPSVRREVPRTRGKQGGSRDITAMRL